MTTLRIGSTCPTCGPRWILTLVDFARGACGRCGLVLGRDVSAERELASAAIERSGTP